MIDFDLAALYGVKTKYLNRQVRRNIERFPADFMFVLSVKEESDLRLQIATANNKLPSSKRRVPINAFTEQGISMLASVLRSKTAVNVSIEIMRSFVMMRRFVIANRTLFQRIGAMELNQLEYKKNANRKFAFSSKSHW